MASTAEAPLKILSSFAGIGGLDLGLSEFGIPATVPLFALLKGM